MDAKEMAHSLLQEQEFRIQDRVLELWVQWRPSIARVQDVGPALGIKGSVTITKQARTSFIVQVKDKYGPHECLHIREPVLRVVDQGPSFG